MSGTIKRRLWSQLWGAASPFLSPTATVRSHASTYSDAAWNAFSQTRSKTTRSIPPTASKNAVRRSFASSGILLFGLNPATAATNGTLASCSTAVEKTLVTSQALEFRQSSPLARQILARAIHSSGRGRTKVPSNRPKSSSASTRNDRKQENGNKQEVKPKEAPTPIAGVNTGHSAHTPESNSFFHLPHLPNLPHLPHLPKMPHRPTKEELLAAATGFWSRLRVHFKWFSIRSVRPWNVDDWSAFISWFVVGHIVWILVGTTTFVSLVILTINTVVAQETLARWVGDYLTQSAGIKVVFESAIVPKWGDGVISFRNVFVSRRPGQGRSRVSKGSSITAAAAAAAERQAEAVDGSEDEQEDTNYTQFDVTIDTVNVTLSFVKWWNGKGLLRDVEVKGVRGVVDRTSVRWGTEYVDPRTYKREHNPGDFEIDSFKMEDLLLTIHQPKGFRPYSVSVFSCELPQLRKQWLFYDFLSASQMSGAFDGSLFNLHPRQAHSLAPPQSNEPSEALGQPDAWKKHSRLRIDGLKIDHLNRGVQGPFGWIQEGNVDIVADIMLPADNHESIAQVMSDLFDRLEATVTSNRYIEVVENNPETTDLNASEQKDTFTERTNRDNDKRFLVMDLRVHLNDVRAQVPIFTRDLSYINQALVRPIVAYINSKQAFIPINCRIVKRAGEFDGSWTIFDSGLMEDLSVEMYDAFAKDVVDSQNRMRRFKKVGLWSLSVAAQALFMGLAAGIA